jgi:hypothetical protein
MLHYDAVPKPVADLLPRLAGHPALADFVLGGGTSLALRAGHRLSVDLDYFTEREFSPEELFEALGLERATILSVSRNSLTLDAGGVKIDLLRHAYSRLAPVEEVEGVSLISLPDLAAMKLNAIANRGSKKDFYDLAELLGSYALTEMLGFFSRKYPATDSFAVIRSLAWFDDAEAEPDPVMLTHRSWGDVKRLVLKAISQL